jgi:large subunit ribosomal protein L25
MPHTIELRAEPRTVVGKKVKQLRRQGLVPANVYGDGVESTPIQVEAKALQQSLAHATATTLVNLTLGESQARRQVLVRDVQWELLKHVPVHVDFYAVRMDAKVKAAVPIVLRGESPAAKHSDVILLHPVSALTVEGRPGDLPEVIEVDVSSLAEVDQAIYARDVPLPSGVTLADPPDELIVKVQLTRAAIEAEAEAAAEAREAPAIAAGTAAEEVGQDADAAKAERGA